MRAVGLAAGLVLLATVAAAGECPVIAPLVFVGGDCAGQDAAGIPTALCAQARASLAMARSPDCPRARLLAAAGRQLHRARVLVGRAVRRGLVDGACAEQLRAQVADAKERLRLLRDRPR